MEFPSKPAKTLPELPFVPLELSAPSLTTATKLTRGVKRKWARVQASELSTDNFQRTEGQTEYNIWYNKYLGNYDHQRVPATTRCNVKRDAGLTKADFVNPNAFVCIFFAKGRCIHGKKCSRLHRVPTREDSLRLDLLHDIFGRQRHAKDREDMGGVGSFNRDCRSLYIKDLSITSVGKMEEILTRHFGEFGEIDQVNVKAKHGCAFVRFVHRANAEFAKIAMAEQSLDGDEQLDVRWANDDSNPRYDRMVKERYEDKMLQAMVSKGYSIQSRGSDANEDIIDEAGNKASMDALLENIDQVK